MSDLLEGPIDDVLDVTASEVQPQAPPFILVEYRDRGASAPLVATMVVLIAALAITSHRRLTPPKVMRVKPTAARDRAPARPDAGRPAVESPEPPFARTAERMVPPDPAPTAQPTLVADAPLTAELTVTEDSATHTDEPMVPPPTDQTAVAEASMAEPAVAPPPPPDPRPSAEEVEREILREAEQRKADIEEMQRLKPEVREIRERERPQRVQEERVTFRKELRAILRAGDDAGRRIAELCDQYGTEVADEQQRIVNWHLRRSSPRASRRDRVALLRALNVPEPAILEDLARYWNRRLGNARNGLRDADAVRVTAAKHLLSMPLATQPAAGSP